jgi:uncharacterized protein (DUF488 family)
MLSRQKAVLSVMKHAGRPVGRTELMKWCFLLRTESATKGGNSFYDFVPYKFGPFSFAMYQELSKLEATSFVQSDGEMWCLNWDQSADVAYGNFALEREITRIVASFGKLSSEELLQYVYQKYPWFTVNSERQRLRDRPTSKVAVFTVGYEGISVDRLLNRLIKGGIERLIDVRNNPVARRYGFHKSTLSRLLNRLDIDYRHFAQLGIKSTVRQLYTFDGDRDIMFEQYEADTLRTESVAVHAVSDFIRERPSALLCMEAEPGNCHRSRLARRVAELTSLPIIHLRFDDEYPEATNQSADYGNDLSASVGTAQ